MSSRKKTTKNVYLIRRNPTNCRALRNPTSARLPKDKVTNSYEKTISIIFFFTDPIQDTSYTKTTTIKRSVIRSIFPRRGTATKAYNFRFTVIVISRYTIQKQTFLGITLEQKPLESAQTPPTLRK